MNNKIYAYLYNQTRSSLVSSQLMYNAKLLQATSHDDIEFYRRMRDNVEAEIFRLDKDHGVLRDT